MASADRAFNLVNQCRYKVWPETVSNSGPSWAPLFQGGTTLTPGMTFQFTAPPAWSGSVWGRSGCNFDDAGAGKCDTGDCSGLLLCNGVGGVSLVSLAEFTLDRAGAQDFYHVSLVDGYNLPLTITATGGTGSYGNPDCVLDLNQSCPPELQELLNGVVVTCMSACEAIGTENYCCTGAYNSATTCMPTPYSQIFKTACPTAYSYVYDDATSAFTCSTPASYTVTFCPTGTR